MYSCDEIKEQLWDIAELDESEIPAHIKEHIENCTECAAEFDEIKKIKADLSSMHEDAPSELVGNVMAAVKKDKRYKTPINKIVKICAASAAAVLLCVFTVHNVMLSEQKNGDMAMPSSPDYNIEKPEAEDVLDDYDKVETPNESEVSPSLGEGRFSELLDFDFSECYYDGIFPDDIGVLYFISADYSEKIDDVLFDCFENKISDRVLYVGTLDINKTTKLDGIYDTKYTRSVYGSVEYFAVIVVEE